MIRMPAEWERQKAVWIAWPHDLFEMGYCMKLEGTYLRMVELMKTSQVVRIVVPDEYYQQRVEQLLDLYRIGRKGVEFFIVSTNDIWIRDFGPTFINRSGVLTAVKWMFNGYGNRFVFDLDDAVGLYLPKMLGIDAIQVPLVLEGGNIETNGKGTFLLCRSAVLNPNRNPGITQEDVELTLKLWLGATRVIWLSGLITEDIEKTGWSDDTDTHVDTVVRFTAENRVVAVWTDDRNCPMYNLLQATHAELKEAGLDVVRLPAVKDGFYSITNIGVGGGMRTDRALRTDASYTNYCLTNNAVIVPLYGKKEDDDAKGILREQFPDREVIGVFAGLLAESGGEFHCITQQEPEV